MTPAMRMRAVNMSVAVRFAPARILLLHRARRKARQETTTKEKRNRKKPEKRRAWQSST